MAKANLNSKKEAIKSLVEALQDRYCQIEMERACIARCRLESVDEGSLVYHLRKAGISPDAIEWVLGHFYEFTKESDDSINAQWRTGYEWKYANGVHYPATSHCGRGRGRNSRKKESKLRKNARWVEYTVSRYKFRQSHWWKRGESQRLYYQQWCW